MKGEQQLQGGTATRENAAKCQYNKAFNTAQKTLGHLREIKSNEIREANQMFASRLEGK